MPLASKRSLAFVRALLPDRTALPDGRGVFRITGGGRATTLETRAVLDLIGSGVLAGDRSGCRPGPDVRSWLRRQLLPDDGLAGQHRDVMQSGTGVLINRAESPLARLASVQAGDSAPFLMPHQVEAGERLRRLVDRAALLPRLTMSYDPTRTAGGRSAAGEIGDMAADARRMLARAMAAMPAECAGVVLDVCGLEKGLQQVESERSWPRRSAKLVLRIGLDQLARHFGLAPAAVGRDIGRMLAWMEEGGRPPMFGEPP